MKAHPLDLILAISNMDRAIEVVCHEFSEPGLTGDQYAALQRLIEANLVGLAAIILLDYDMTGTPDNDWCRDRFYALLRHVEGQAS